MSARNWSLGSKERWEARFGATQKPGYKGNSRCNVHLPTDHWTYKAEGKGKPVPLPKDIDDEEAELDLDLAHLEEFEEYRAEADEVGELFK